MTPVGGSSLSSTLTTSPVMMFSLIVSCMSSLRRSVGMLTVEPILFIDTFANGLTGMAVRAIAFDRVCLTSLHLQPDDGPKLSSCPISNLTSDQLLVVHRDASRLEFYRTLCVSLPAMFLIVIYSSMADRWSRKYVILLGPIGSLLPTAICLLVSINIHWPPTALLTAATVAGLSGGFVTLLGTCLGYLTAVAMTNSDVIPVNGGRQQQRPPGSRILRLTIAEAFMQIGRTTSSAVSGNLLSAVGATTVFAIGIGLNVVEILYVVIRLKDNPKVSTIGSEAPLPVSALTLNDDEYTGSTSFMSTDDGDTKDGEMRTDRAETNGQKMKCCTGLCNDVDFHTVCHRRGQLVCSWRHLSDVGRIIGQYFYDYVRTVVKRRHGNRRLYLIILVIFTGVESLVFYSVCM